MAPADRDAWLATEGRRRLERLVRLVDEQGRPWVSRPNPVTAATMPGDGWYLDYRSPRT
jgi:hypothetical protein